MSYQFEFENLLGVKLVVNQHGESQRIHCPLGVHNNIIPLFSVNVEKGLWYCRRCRQGGNLYQLAKLLLETIS